MLAVSAACFSWSNAVRTLSVAAEASASRRRPLRLCPATRLEKSSSSVRVKRWSHSPRLLRKASISPSGMWLTDSKRSPDISSDALTMSCSLSEYCV